MDPLAIQAGQEARAVRPVLALDASLTAVLREGRVVAGEVLQSMDGHSVLIGVGRHRVPAEAQVDLSPGDRFLARVERSGQDVVLHMLGGGPGEESRLLLALRSVVAEDRPIGELLGDVATRLRAALASDGDGEPAFARLLRQLGTHVLEPGSGAAELRDLLARSGLDYESQLLGLAGGGKAAAQLHQALAGLVQQVVARLRALWSGQGLQLSANQLETLGGRLLLSLSGLRPGGGTGAEALAQLAAQIEARLGNGLASGASGALRQLALAALPGLVAELLGGASGDGTLEGVFRALQRSGDPALLADNLKAQLLAAHAELPEGAVRESIGRALAGLESEQLLNLARGEFREGWHLSIPVPDGGAWTTAHLFYADPEAGHAGAHADGEDMHRLTVAVEYSGLGPLRGDLGVRDDLVAMRLLVTDEAVATRLRAEVPVLAERLDAAGRTVRISVAVVPRPEAEVDALSTNIRWLREHHLMDRSA